MALSKEAKQIKQVPAGFACTIKGYRRLWDFTRKEYINSYKDYTDEDIFDMIRIENKLARRQH